MSTWKKVNEELPHLIDDKGLIRSKSVLLKLKDIQDGELCYSVGHLAKNNNNANTIANWYVYDEYLDAVYLKVIEWQEIIP